MTTTVTISETTPPETSQEETELESATMEANPTIVNQVAEQIEERIEERRIQDFNSAEIRDSLSSLHQSVSVLMAERARDREMLLEMFERNSGEPESGEEIEVTEIALAPENPVGIGETVPAGVQRATLSAKVNRFCKAIFLGRE